MAYQSWSVVFGEQPSAAKWNILGTNDAGFNDGTAIGDDAIQSRHIDWANTGGGDNGGIWWEELGRTTLGSAGDTITISSISARKYLRILIAVQATGGTVNANLRFNNDSSTNYARRISNNGAADGTAGSDNEILEFVAGQYPWFITCDVINISNQEKIAIMQVVGQNTAGAGNVPVRNEAVGKWANTSAQITRVDVVNTGTGDFAIGSEVVVLGHN